jgi:hypothetical protein
MKTITAPIAAATPATTPAPTETAPAATPGTGETPATQPTTPEQLRDVKLAQLLEQKPSFETLKALGLAKLVDLAKENVDAEKRLKTGHDRFKKTAKGVGKVLAAMKISYAEAQDGGTLSRGTSFDDYHKKVAGEKAWNHAMQCARVFLELVLTGKLSEADYDRRAADWHQHASAILGEITKAGLKLDCPEVAELVDILKNAADDEGAKQLRAMKAKIKGNGTEAGEPGDAEIMTVTDFRNADVLVRRVCQLTYDVSGSKVDGLKFVAAIVAEYFATSTNPDTRYSVFKAMDAAFEAVDSETLTEWTARRDQENAPAVELQNSPAPANKAA